MQKILSFEPDKADEHDRRLLYASFIVFLIFSFIMSHLFTRNMFWQLLGGEESITLETRAEKEKVYQVLLEQDYKDTRIKDEIKALSDVNAAGTGGLTEKEGFHTDTSFNEFVIGKNSVQGNKKSIKKEITESDLNEVGIFRESMSVSDEAGEQGSLTKIPFNYRFQPDFLFRWDGSQALSIPRKKLAGYQYFKHMLKMIEASFAPPGGGNFAYRDIAGTVIREGIKPGETKVMFMLDAQGRVIDIKLASSQGQAVVDRACLDSIRGNVFGIVPEEVKVNGMIFGINFIFPGSR